MRVRLILTIIVLVVIFVSSWVQQEDCRNSVFEEKVNGVSWVAPPDFVGDSEFKDAIIANINKGKLSANHRIKFESIHEGKSAQILHIGSYDEEKASLEKLYAFIEQEGLEISGYHHEIYLSDPRKVAEEKLKTILRYAVK